MAASGGVCVPVTHRRSPVPWRDVRSLWLEADLNQAQPEAGPSFTGDLAGGLFPAIPLTPVPATASRHGGESDAVGGPSGAPDLSREGPFDMHLDNPCSAASLQLLQDTQGCPFRMTSYDEGTGGPNFATAYGVQLHDPHLLEYVGAPESARLTSRSPEYWVHHMGREKAVSATLQLQHDTFECPGPAAVSDSTKPDIVGCFAGSPRSSAISGGGYATSDIIVQSPLRGTLYDGEGSVAPASRY